MEFQSPLGTNFSYATSFRMPILMSALFDDALIHAVGTTVGTEARAFANYGFAGLDFWTPNINPFRDPRWGRGMETPGEGPYVLQQYVYNLVTGLQGGVDPADKLVISTYKHFAPTISSKPKRPTTWIRQSKTSPNIIFPVSRAVSGMRGARPLCAHIQLCSASRPVQTNTSCRPSCANIGTFPLHIIGCCPTVMQLDISIVTTIMWTALKRQQP